MQLPLRQSAEAGGLRRRLAVWGSEVVHLRRLLIGCVSLTLAAGSMVLLSSPGQASGASSNAPINVGFVCQCTGAEASSLSVAPPAYEAWADYVNASGGINGHKVHVIVKDDAGNPSTSLTDVEQLIGQDHVVALADNTNLDFTWSTYAEQHKVPVIGVFTNSTTFYMNSDFFAEGQTQSAVNTSMILAAKKMSGHKLAYLYCAEAAVCAEGVKYLVTAGSSLGVPVIYKTAVSASAPSYVAPCLAAKESGADVLWVAQVVTATQNAISDCATQGYTPIELATSSGVAPDFATAKGMDNHLITTQPDIPFSVKNTPGTKTMYSALKKYAPSILTSPNFNEEAVMGWVSGLLLEAAVKAGPPGAVTGSEVLSGLYKLKDDTLGGMAPPLTFKQGQLHQINCWFYMAAQDGKWVALDGAKPVCHQPVKGSF